MSAILLCMTVLVTILTAYSLRFCEATLLVGRGLADSDSNAGYQDAISPPWQTNLALMAYTGTLAVLVAIWWQNGFGACFVGLILVIIGVGITQAILPKADSSHFERLILRSMVKRYADFVRDGDEGRAEAMRFLLQKSGLEPEASLNQA